MEARFDQPDFKAAFSDIGILDFPSLLAQEAIPEKTLSNTPPPARVHTLFHPILSYQAARGFFMGSNSILPTTNDNRAAAAGAKHSLIRRFLASLPAERRAAAREKIGRKLCTVVTPACLTFMAGWKHDFPDDIEHETLFQELRQDALLENRKEEMAHLNSVALQRLGSLFDSSGFPYLPVSYKNAERILSLFNNFYSHAAPFNALSLQSLWERCGKTDKRCSDKLEEIRNIGIRPLPAQTRLGSP
jgi:hypothetical protein